MNTRTETSLKSFSLLALAWVLQVAFLQGQDFPPSYYISKYDGEFAVKLKDHSKVEIDIKRGKLDITHYIYQENLFLDKRAGSYTNTSINYEPPFTDIGSLKAYTLKPESGKDKYNRIKVKDLTDRQLMSSRYFDGRRAKVFAWPGLMKGAITVLEYERKILEPRLLGSEVFQSHQVKEEHIFSLSYEKGVEIDVQYINCSEEDFHHQVEQKFRKTVETWVPKNMAKMRQEESMPEYLQVAPHIVYRIKSYEHRGETYPVLRNVDDLKQWYIGFLDQVNADSSREIGTITDSILSGAASDDDKVRRIFQWVQKNIKYIAFEEGLEGFRPRPPSSVMQKRYGDCKDMSCLTVSMLQHAGVPAYHTWIGTRKLPYTYHQVPTPLTDNHMIATAKINDRLVYLDATDEGLPYPLPSSFIQGKEALVLFRPDSFEIAKVPVVNSLKNLIYDSIEVHIQNTTLKGSGSRNFHGYYASMMKRKLNSSEKNDIDKILKPHLSKGNNKCRSYSLAVNHDAVKTSVDYDLEVPDYVYTNGDELIINMNLEKIMSDFQIGKERKHPLAQEFKYLIKRRYILEIPEGYQLSFIPENHQFEHEDFGFSVRYEKSGTGHLTYLLDINVDTLQIENDQFESWNAMIKELNKNYNESIILKKA